MAETVKKTRTPKPAAEKKEPTEKKAAAPKAKQSSPDTGKIHLMPPTHEQIASLAHKYWAEGGHRHGQHEADWYRAEQELRGKAS